MDIDMDDVCVLCDEKLSIKEVTKIYCKGLATFTRVSERLHDGKSNLWINKDHISVHADCRKEYTRETSIQAKLKKKRAESNASTSASPIKKKLRCSKPEFSFKVMCFICGEICDQEAEKKKPQHRRKKIWNVSTLDLLGKVLKGADKRQDDLGKSVKNRLSGISCLVAEEARYHELCMNKFFHPKTEHKAVGRPETDATTKAFEKIIHNIENSDDYQFSLKSLVEETNNEISEKTLRRKLKEKYGERIVVTDIPYKDSVVCLRDVSHRILNEAWYQAKNQDIKEERLRIVRTAAEIVKEDIILQQCDNSTYPPPSELFENCDQFIPETLKVLLHGIVMNKSNKGNQEKLQKKISVICHSITAAVRPRSFLSQIQLGLGIYLHRKFGSRMILDVLSSIGLCASYREILNYEAAAVLKGSPKVNDRAFHQFVFDNADINVNTIDGHDTFHCMGGIKCITPSEFVEETSSLERRSSIPSSEILNAYEKIEIKNFSRDLNQGLKQVIVQDLDKVEPQSQDCGIMEREDMIWLCGKWLQIPLVPSWNGFMDAITKTQQYETSRIQFLPFVDLPASSYEAIASVLNYASKKSKEVGQKACVVTFDLPLYAKARDITSSSSELSHVTVRLGGFHTLMSFMGGIGTIMSGSGLKELWAQCYAVNSTDKMMTGHSFARALRAHFLTQSALGIILLDTIEISDTEKCEIADLLKDFDANPPSLSSLKTSEVASSILSKFYKFIDTLSEKGPTAKLWVQYFNSVTIIRNFIKAERMGDFQLHLASLRKMLPIFHASGHLAYAKYSHLYLQDMYSLQEKFKKEELEKFLNGYFTVRRSDKLWAGVWSDMTIEQTLMRSIKTGGGLSSGRGVSDTVIAKWIQGAPAVVEVIENVEKFCGVRSVTSSQHVELRQSRIKRDTEDLNKFVEWFKTHPPFINNDKLMSLATGVVADETVNCHNSFEIGISSMQNMVDKNFEDIKMTRKNKVVAISAMNKGIKFNDTVISVDTNLLYQRIIRSIQDETELERCFEFELSPVPQALFDDTGAMRKTTKSSLYKMFDCIKQEINFKDCHHVIDGGFLLHKVVWPRNATFHDVFNSYINFVRNNYGVDVTVVFDGYDQTALNTKAAERQRRYTKSKCTDIIFDESTKVTTNQESFLSNEKNKSRFIVMLMKKLSEYSFGVRQALDDADTLIVATAINYDTSKPVVIVGEDVDLLVLLVALAPANKVTYFLKPARGKVERQIYSSTELQAKNKDILDHLLFIHAASGCDTTSAFCHKGKTKMFTLLRKDADLCHMIDIFNKENAEPNKIAEVGENVVLNLYGANKQEQASGLDNFRFKSFTKAVVKNKSAVKLDALPPTSGAVKFHFFRVYYQVQLWRGRILSPEDWGWKINNNYLQPVQSDKPAAPESLLKLISCSCVKGCESGRCTCKKAGLHCSKLCMHCSGAGCANSPSLEIIEDDEDDNNGDTELDNEFL